MQHAEWGLVELLVPMTWPIDPKSADLSGQYDMLIKYKDSFLAKRRPQPLEIIGKALLALIGIPFR
jgi:hypothetical protein